MSRVRRRRLRSGLRRILIAAGLGAWRRQGMLAAASVVALCVAGSGQTPREAPIFRLVSFEAGGDVRLGATQGNGDADIVDVYNTRSPTFNMEVTVERLGTLRSRVASDASAAANR